MADALSGASQPVIRVIAMTPEDEHLWKVVANVARVFGRDEPWVLVGGLMVQLFSFEHQAVTRPTTDIDVLGDARTRSMTKRMSQALVDRGGRLSNAPRGEHALAYAFDFQGATVEVLAPDGLKSSAKTVAKCTTIEVPGGTQALKRAEVVRLSVNGGRSFAVRRPNLLGAILMKARVLAKRRTKFESDRQDLIRLLNFVGDPSEESRHLSGSERGWLRGVETAIAFRDGSELADFDSYELTRAEQALRLLSAQRD